MTTSTRCTRSLSPRCLAITDQLLAILDGESPLPVPTGYLWRKISPLPDSLPARRRMVDEGRYVDYGAVLRLLNRLARLGEIEKWPANEDRRSCLALAKHAGVTP